MTLEENLPDDWKTALSAETAKPYFAELAAFVAEERAKHSVFPPEADEFNALRLTPLESVRVVILGQDPYHNEGQAHGLAFSVQPGVTPPPSLKNMFKELKDDVGIDTPKGIGTLTPWAKQGVLLLNTALTVRAHEPASHKGKGWETFTDAIIRVVSAKPEPVVFVLWGAHAQKKQAFLTERDIVIASAHPSPLSAKTGFFGSKPFSRVNAALEAAGKAPIDWRLPA